MNSFEKSWNQYNSSPKSSASLEGFFLHKMHWVERIVCVVGGLLLIYPGVVTDLIGVALVGCILIVQWLTKKKSNPEPC